MPKPQRFCIYCGGPHLTKEHLYADWLGKHIPSRVKVHNIHMSVVGPQTSSARVEMRTGDTHARKIRRVCRTCNGGWMSELQQAVKPYLVPMIHGEQINLSRAAQKIVSAWATMVTMTSEFINDDYVAVSQADRDYLRLTSAVPKGWRIFAGQYQWSPGAERWTHNVMCLAEDGFVGPAGDTSHPSNTQTTTICVGNKLFFHVMSSSVGPGRRLIHRWSFGPLATAMRQIGPAAAASVRWPPETCLSARGVGLASNALYEVCAKAMRKQAASR